MRTMSGGDDDRRTFLEKLVWLGGLLFGGLASLPLLGALVDPVVRGGRGRRGKLVRVATLETLEPGKPVKATIVGEVVDSWTRSPRRRLGAVWVVRGEGDAVQAFSVVCPHLGCGIDHTEGDDEFRCPCHDSKFRLDGTRTTGPSPRGMDALETKVEDGEVLVRFAKFKQGTRDRREVG
jgi:menaquinol-cytochrome c reductase iron-sulfur subunit